MADQKSKNNLNTEVPAQPTDQVGVSVGMNSMNEATHTKLNELHKRLLRLHKILLDDERKRYEELHGRVEAAGTMLNLVMYDPFFDWLHRISESIIRIDELTDRKRPVSGSPLEEVSDLLTKLRTLFKASADTEFMNRYKAIMQRDPRSRTRTHGSTETPYS